MVLFSLLVVGCSAVADLIPAEGEVLLASVSGSEEALAAEGSFASVSAQPEADRPDPMRECDGASTYEAVFGRYDADADGALDALETEEVRSERAFRAEDESRRVRHQWELLVLLYDVDGDGTLGESERATLLDDFTVRCDALQARLLEEFDADGDGALSADEEAAARSALEEGAHGQCPEEGGRPEGGGAEGRSDSGRPAGPPPEGEYPPFIVDEFDLDADGTLSSTELETVRTTIRERIRAGEPLVGPFAPPPPM